MAQGSAVDFLVMGAGVAGLRAAIELARHGEVLVVTKESLGESNTHYAQGGIAVAMEGDEDIALHLEDTVNAGDGLVYRPAAEALVSEGPLRVAELIEWGANFDRADGPEGYRLERPSLLRTREGAHSLARILHAQRRRHRRRDQPRTRCICPRAQTHSLCRVDPGRRVLSSPMAASSAPILPAPNPRSRSLAPRAAAASDAASLARTFLIASGGAGQVYSDTTNPAVATGDGIALAAQAGRRTR